MALGSRPPRRDAKRLQSPVENREIVWSHSFVLAAWHLPRCFATLSPLATDRPWHTNRPAPASGRARLGCGFRRADRPAVSRLAVPPVQLQYL